MRTLSRYFVARYLGLFLVILCVATLAIAVVEFLLGFEEVEDGQLLRWLLVRIPSYYLRDLVPISGFFAAFFALALAVRWLEWTAIMSAGISPWRIAWPILAVSVLLAVASAGIRESLLPPLLAGEVAHRGAGDEDLLLRAGSFWYQKGRTIYSIGDADPASGTLRGVEIFERTPRGRLRSNIVAETARVRPDGSWLLEKATVREFDPEAPSERARIHELPEMVVAVSSSSKLLLEQSDAALLSLPDLIEHVAQRQSDTYAGSGAAKRRLELVIAQRLADPWLVILFTLLAMPLALTVRPGGSLAPAAVMALVTLAAFFLARGLALGLTEEGMVSSSAGVMIVPLAFAVLGVGALARRIARVHASR